MPSNGESGSPAVHTPDIDRLPFAFTPEHPGERLRVAVFSRLLVDGALGAGSAVAQLVPDVAGRPAARIWARTLARALDLTIDVSGLANIEPGRPYLVAPLHESFVDVPVLLHLPLDLRFTVREELMDHDVIGAMLCSTDQIVVPEPPTVATLRVLVNDVRAASEAGESVVVFPQGSVLGVEAAFSTAVVTLSRKLGLPILPVVLTGTHRVWGHPFDNVVRLHQTVTMHVLEPITAAHVDADSIRHLERTMKKLALSQLAAPVRRFDPNQDGWWDGYEYTIDEGFPTLAAAVADHRALMIDDIGRRLETDADMSKEGDRDCRCCDTAPGRLAYGNRGGFKMARYL